MIVSLDSSGAVLKQYTSKVLVQTRKDSIGMSTAVTVGGVLLGGLLPGGVLPGVVLLGVCASGGGVLPGGGECASGGVYPSMH